MKCFLGWNRTEYQQSCLCLLTNGLHQRNQLWTLNVSLDASCNLWIKARCAVVWINKATWRAFDTILRLTCKCLQYSLHPLDLCWAVGLNGFWKRQEGCLFDYKSIYLFRSSELISSTNSGMPFFFVLAAHINTTLNSPEADLSTHWVVRLGDLHTCPCAFFIRLSWCTLNRRSPRVAVNNRSNLLDFGTLLGCACLKM